MPCSAAISAPAAGERGKVVVGEEDLGGREGGGRQGSKVLRWQPESQGPLRSSWLAHPKCCLPCGSRPARRYRSVNVRYHCTRAHQSSAGRPGTTARAGLASSASRSIVCSCESVMASSASRRVPWSAASTRHVLQCTRGRRRGRVCGHGRLASMRGTGRRRSCHARTRSGAWPSLAASADEGRVARLAHNLLESAPHNTADTTDALTPSRQPLRSHCAFAASSSWVCSSSAPSSGSGGGSDVTATARWVAACSSWRRGRAGLRNG